MAYIIGIILVIIALIIVGLILRKRVYDVVDRQESWKLDIMDRDIAVQLGQIKKLNLSGETQEKFESWKERWETIVTKESSDIEEVLFDAEEAADRYRFSSAKKLLYKSEQMLHSIEKDIENILHELNDLLDSEKTSRQEIETLEPNIKSLRKNISQNRYQYGKAEAYFDTEIDRMEEGLLNYHDLVASGDYLEAKQLVIHLKENVEELTVQIDEFPAIYRKTRQDLPSQLNELHSGIKGMKEDGYRVDYLAFEEEIQNYQQRLKKCITSLDNGDTSEAKPLIEDIEERMTDMYQLLEKEAIAKSYMETQIPGYQNALEELTTSFADTKLEVEKMKTAYYFEDSDMEKYLALEKAMTQLNNQLEELIDAMNNEGKSHSKLRELLDEGFQQIEALKEKHQAFKKRIHNLRKDEIEAKEKLTDIREQIYDTNRKLQKSNIPGVPNFIWNLMEGAAEKNEQAIKALGKQPLELSEVQQALTDAKTAVDKLVEQTDLLLEQAALTEHVIQYANRYRSKYPLLAAKLAEAERLFRSYEYDLALEHAAKAVEEIEPGALKRIEEYQQVPN